MLAKTFAGLEEVLKEELIQIGAQNVTPVLRGVKFTGTKETLYKANFCCRTALRVLRIIGEYKVKSSNDLYNHVRKIEWTDYFDVNQTFSVSSTVNTEAFNNSMFVSLKTKDAIVDQFRSKLNKRPSVNTEEPDVRINVHASADTFTLSLDSSGESLHKRGYRTGQNEASMSEVLAAGILLIAGWKGQCDFYDPMCGSGTLPIEAALIARNIPPGMFRKSFAFEAWPDFDRDLFDEVYNADYEREFEHTIYASDISSGNVRLASENARNAGLKKGIEFSASDFASLRPASQSGLLVVNPPYGQRMNDRKVEPLYTMIGDQLKKNFNGFNAWIFSNSEEGLKSVGLRHAQKIKLFNGALECELRSYDLYEGSKKFTPRENFDRNGSDNRPSGSRFSGNRSSSSRPTGDRPFRDRPVGDRSHRDRPSGNRTAGDRPYRDRPSGDRTYRDKSSGDRPFREKPSGDRPFRDKPFGDRPFRERPSGDRISRNRPSGDRVFGEKPNAVLSSESKPSEDKKSFAPREGKKTWKDIEPKRRRERRPPQSS